MLLQTRAFLTRVLLYLAVTLALVVDNSAPVWGERSFQNGFPADPGFFPVGVWLQSPESAPKYRAMGVNTFVGLWKGPTETQLTELSKQGMYVIAEQNTLALHSVNRAVIKGWMQSDEPDNAQMPMLGLGRYSPCIPAAEVARRSQAIKTRDPTRPVLINFGRGVADTSWPGRGTCTGDQSYYDAAIVGADILSFDIYPVGSDTPRVKGRLDFVGRGVANLVRRASPRQRVWTAIETTALDPARPPKPREVRAEVWMALIHGARGIVYFVHEWAPSFREDGILRHPEIVEEVATIDSTIASLAPILNSPNLTGQIDDLSGAPIATMVKQKEDALYLFAVAMQDQPLTLRLTVRGVRDAEAVVLDEDRSIPVSNGVLEDTFAGYAVHFYRIPLSRENGRKS
jgi:hypothetical protein